MSKMKELADQIATDCAAMKDRPKLETTYNVEFTVQERNDVLTALERLAGEHMDYVRENLDEHPDLAFTYHQAAHACRALANKLREAEPDEYMTGGWIGESVATQVKNSHGISLGTAFVDINPLPNVDEERVKKAKKIVSLLDEAHANHQSEFGDQVEIKGPRGWISLTDVLDDLLAALNSDGE